MRVDRALARAVLQVQIISWHGVIAVLSRGYTRRCITFLLCALVVNTLGDALGGNPYKKKLKKVIRR